MNKLARFCGPLLKLTALGHTLYGLVWYRHELAALAMQHPFAAVPVVEHRHPAEAVLWFFAISPLLYLIGSAASWAHQRTGELPRAMGWWLLGAALAVFVVAPLSGAIVVIPQAILWLYVTRPAREVMAHA